MTVEKWGFLGFLYIVTGPMVLLIANRLLTEKPEHEERVEFSREQYLRVSRRLFSVLAILMIWVIGTDIVLGKGITADSGANIAALVLFCALAVSRNERLHSVVTVLFYLLTVALFALRGVP